MWIAFTFTDVSPLILGIAVLLFPAAIVITVLVALGTRTGPRRRAALSVLAMLLRYRGRRR